LYAIPARGATAWCDGE